jgi:hypothetical protein
MRPSIEQPPQTPSSNRRCLHGLVSAAFVPIRRSRFGQSRRQLGKSGGHFPILPLLGEPLF